MKMGSYAKFVTRMYDVHICLWSSFGLSEGFLQGAKNTYLENKWLINNLTRYLVQKK